MIDDPQSALRAAIRRRRRQLGLTQDEFSALAGMTRVTYNRIETGARRIRLEELSCLCTALGCSVAELVEDKVLARLVECVARALLGPDPQPAAIR
jgi:transcriptional regulator with XRE-family HTH domain